MKSYRRAYVEISNICNLQCSFCPPVARNKHVMSHATFALVAPQLVPLVDEVCLHLMGEPLNHPEADQIFETCAHHGMPINLTTNGLLLTGPRFAMALRPIVRQVNVSSHSFAANFPSQDPGPYVDRILAFAQAALTNRPDLYVNIRLWDLTEDASIEAGNAEIRRRIGETFAVALDTPDIRRKKSLRLAGRVSAHFDSRFTWPAPNLPVRTTTGFCHGLSSHFGVHADGTVVPCCLDKEAVLALGNCTEEPLAAILTSPRAKKMRTGFAQGNLVEDLCQRCPFVARFDGRARKLKKGVSVGRSDAFPDVQSM